MNRYARIFFPIAVVFPMLGLYAQTNVPTSATAPAGAVARPLPPAYQSVPVDYLRVYTPNKPLQDTSLVNMTALVEDVGISTQYMDSYGRNIQTVSRQSSPGKNDMVASVLYDEFGRASITYLPFTAQSGNTNDGRIKFNPYVQDSAFYKGLQPNEQVIYGQQLYDGSPLNIVIKNMAPGNSWGGTGVGNSYVHRTNTVSDSVHLWTIAINGEDDVPVTSTFYQPGTLAVVQKTDEKGVVSIDYTDALGRTVLVKTQLATSPGTGHNGWLCTYYVYDETSHLRMVIPPKAVESLNNTSNNWSLSHDTTIKKNLCYAYFYDSRNRMTEKYIPGKGKVYFAYDIFDRPVLLQDPHLRASNQWNFILYDGQSRPIKNGLITLTLSKDSILAQAGRSNSYPSLTGTYTIMTETYYDDYTWVTTTGASVDGTLQTANINATNFNTSYNSFPDYPQPLTASGRTRGMITGTKSNIVNSSNYLYTSKIYDDHGRVIQSQQNNYTGGIDVATIQYGFSGRVLRSHFQQQKSGINAQTHTILTKYAYDHVGRVKSLIKNVDDLGDKTISQETYNEGGQMITKIIGSSTSETEQYTYNIRGWMSSINKDYVNTAGNTSSYFGEILAYDYGFTNNQLNGNIAGIKWKTGGDGIIRAYGFTYDNNNRLITADFTQQSQSSSSWSNGTVDYSVSGLTYDAAGNILSLRQKGLKVGSSVTIDSLTYQYFTNSNQLEKVSDGIKDTSPLGDFKDSAVSGDDYTYDINGNINKDYNRHMYSSSNGPGAVFNYLDRPDSIVMAGKAGIHYFYDAAGNQLAKQVNDYTGSLPAVKTFLYINGFVYLNDTLQYVLQEEGRIRYAKKTNSQTGALYYAFEYDYFLKDHLGNVRTVLTEGRDTATYAATMESKDSATVAALFSNVYTPVNTVFAKPMAFDTDTSNHFVARLNASAAVNQKTGPSLVLKVMAGDQVQISTFAYYNTAVQPPVNGINLLPDILNLLSGGVIANSAGKFVAGDASGLSNALSPNVTQFLNTGRTYDNTQPKAYLNWILFDNQFNYIASNSGVQQVVAGTNKQALIAPLQNINKNGYLYVYLSNESPQDVYFDNLTIKHYSGPLAQEQSYYPFGLQMPGISDKALLKPVSPYKANGGIELEEDYGLNYYNTDHRKYDPQIGRFTGIDALGEASISMSSYHFGANNPISFVDPNGLYHAGAPSMEPAWLDDLLDSPDNGGGNGFVTGGGASNNGWGTGSYANYYQGLFNATPDDGSIYEYSNSNSSQATTIYNYATSDGAFSFETPGYHGQESMTSGDLYIYQGTVVKNSLPSMPQESESQANVMGEESSFNLDKTAGAVGLAFDAHNFSMDGVAVLAKESSVITKGFKIAAKTTGLIGVTLAGGMAIKNIVTNFTNGSKQSWNDWASLGLGVVSAVALFNPLGGAAEVVAIVADVLTITNDAYSASKL